MAFHNLDIVGLGRRPLRDAYHFLLQRSWGQTLVVIAAGYVAVNLVFALVYLALGAGAVENMAAGSFSDAFFFSVQTMATIGYGKMVPATAPAHLVVTVEALVGMLAMAMATGLLFTKFARPSARVRFSRHAVITRCDGGPALMFRVVNERGDRVFDVQGVAVLIQDEERCGDTVERRVRTLTLADPLVLGITWTGVHLIDAESPLRDATAASLAARGGEIVVSISAYDPTLAETTRARHIYRAADLRFGEELAPIASRARAGGRRLDVSRLSELAQR